MIAATRPGSPLLRALQVSVLGLLAIVLAGSLDLQASAQLADRKESPFEGLRWAGEQPEVLVSGEWYEPQSIHGVMVTDILKFCEERWPGRMKKRFGEDLVEAMNLMGHELPSEVDLELKRLGAAEILVKRGVALTRENREAIRKGTEKERPRRPAPTSPATLERKQALEDLDALAAGLEDQFAYLELGEFKWRKDLDKLRKSLPKEIATGELSRRVSYFMAHFRDGHASASSEHPVRPERYPPFLLQEAEGGIVAFLPDRSAFIDEKHPYVDRIDGVKIEKWIERAAEWEASGSPQLVRRRALRGLRSLDLLRTEKERKNPEEVVLKLKGAGRRKPVEVDLKMGSRKPTFGEWPQTKSRILEGNLGYLRLPRMDDELVPELRKRMEEFRRTEGLIVDVRGNGGGSRSLLIALAGYLVGPEDKPWVGNVAKYILSDKFGEDHLEARFMKRATDDSWNEPQRLAIEEFARAFKPEWTPPGEFSEWHYLVLDRTGHEDEYFYEKPILVLSDSWCFSATDIFLGALIGRPRVTLMGEASAGGSARSQSFELPHSQIRVRCASMVSYRPDGRLYDGRGVEVDVPVQTRATDLLQGGTDHVLEAALDRLR